MIDAKQVDNDEEIILISDLGKMIRMDLSSLRIIGRSTQGVKLINIEENEKVVGLDNLAKEKTSDDEEIIEGEDLIEPATDSDFKSDE